MLSERWSSQHSVLVCGDDRSLKVVTGDRVLPGRECYGLVDVDTRYSNSITSPPKADRDGRDR